MKRFASFLIILILIITLGFWLGDEAGVATIVWHDYIIETSAAFLLLLILMLASILFITARLLYHLSHSPKVWRRERHLRLMLEGHHHLGAALTALSAGNQSVAQDHARLARKKLGFTPVTQFFEAHIKGDGDQHHQNSANFIDRSVLAASSGHMREAIANAKKAFRQSPDWLPAVINLARCRMQAGQNWRARRLIESQWESFAHPELADIYAANCSSELESYRRMKKLCRLSNNTLLSSMLCAEAALKAKLWGEARNYLTSILPNGQATQRAYRLMSEIEREGYKNTKAADDYLINSIDAPLDPVWLCSYCGGSQEIWKTQCRHCGQRLTLDWRSPGVSQIHSLPKLTNASKKS